MTADDAFRLTEHLTPAMGYLGAFGGLRIGEVLGLEVADIDFLSRRVTVRRTASEVGGEVIIGPPKTQKSRRTGGRFVIDVISDDLAGRRSGLVFTHDARGPMRRTDWAKRTWKPEVEAGDL